jgi:glycosyltransferase involved in cell wall biosynthesis
MPDMDTLRIVHVLRAPMGGLFRHVRDLALAQEAEGHAVAVLCDAAGTAGYNEAMVAELERGTTLGVKRVPMRREVGPRDLIDARNVLKILKELQPNVLHGHGAKGGVFARALGSLVRADRSRVARLYSPHGGSLHYDRRSNAGRVYFRVERLLERATDHILFVAAYEKRVYAEKIGEPSCPWSINHNGLRDEEFTPVHRMPDAADFLFLGELRMLKGPDIFLQALAGLRAKGFSEIRAVMVGDGPDKRSVMSLANSLDLSDAIEFRAPMPAREAFALARVFVMPSRAEALPYVVLEALGARIPVIATEVGGIPEIFGPGCPALCAPETDAIATAMRLALEDPDRLQGWMPSESTIRQNFSADTMAANVLRAYRAALTINASWASRKA